MQTSIFLKLTFSCSINCKLCHFHEPLSLMIMHLLQTPKMDHEKVNSSYKTKSLAAKTPLSFIINILCSTNDPLPRVTKFGSMSFSSMSYDSVCLILTNSFHKMWFQNSETCYFILLSILKSLYFLNFSF